MVENLVQRGENVRALVRDPSRVKDWSTGKVELVKGDALKIEDVTEASQGVTSIFHCVNVPYQEWNTKAIPMLENTIAAAKLNKAKIMFPGNVYVFGHVHTDTVGEDQPFAPHTAKGKLRVRMEQMLSQSWRSDSVPYTIVRFPDFYGPHVLNPLYGQIFQNALLGKPMRWYGRLDVPIEFCYIEDAAKALVTAGLSATTNGETYHVPGPGVTTPKEWLLCRHPSRNLQPLGQGVSGNALPERRAANPKRNKVPNQVWRNTRDSIPRWNQENHRLVQESASPDSQLATRRPDLCLTIFANCLNRTATGDVLCNICTIP